MEDNGLTTYQLAQIRNALEQGGSAGGAKLAGGLQLGAVEFGAGAGNLGLLGSIRDSQVLGAGVYRASALAIPNNAWTVIPFTTERFDADDCWDAASPTRLTAKTAGVYVAYMLAQFASNPNGYRGVAILLNGVGYRALNSMTVGATGWADLSTCCVLLLDVGDYLEAFALQNSGGALNLNYSAGTNAPEFAMVRVA